jgi:hypothetical protein
MVDLIVPANSVLTIDGGFAVAPAYGLLRMEANAKIVAKVDLTLKAKSAEFAAGCVIDASGAPGAAGAFGLGDGGNGGAGQKGGRGQNVVIAAGLAQPGGLTIITDGGPGGQGGVGAAGFGHSFGSGDSGGSGGAGGQGGDAGQITLTWTRMAPGLPSTPGVAPPGHVYHSAGGQGGMGGPGGPGGNAGAFGNPGPSGGAGSKGANGAGSQPQIVWWADLASLLWIQSQDMGPAARGGHGLAFDPARESLVLFGGNAGGLVGDTWEWDGKLWTQVADTGPAPRASHGMAYDLAGRQALVFGGAAAVGPQPNMWRFLSDTWGWDGESWVQLADTGPTARQALAMATYPGRDRVTLFGGGWFDNEGNGLFASDTWEWDGAEWTQVADTGPSSRMGAAMTYDWTGGQMLLFGGAAGGPALGDTWSWNGKDWRQVADAGPPARTNHAMAPMAEGVILFGGQQPGGAGPFNDTWAWSRGAWRQIQDMGPAPRSGHAMDCVVDGGGERVTLFGGVNGGFLKDTWRLAERG